VDFYLKASIQKIIHLVGKIVVRNLQLELTCTEVMLKFEFKFEMEHASKNIMSIICAFLLPIDLIALSWCCHKLRYIKNWVVPSFRKNLKFTEHEGVYLYGSYLLHKICGTAYVDIDINISNKKVWRNYIKNLRITGAPCHTMTGFGKRPYMCTFPQHKLQIVWNDHTHFPKYIGNTDLDICQNWYSQGVLHIEFPESVMRRSAKFMKISDFTYCAKHYLRVQKYRAKGFRVTVPDKFATIMRSALVSDYRIRSGNYYTYRYLKCVDQFVENWKCGDVVKYAKRCLMYIYALKNVADSNLNAKKKKMIYSP
jgi:hypothetical protein